MPIHVYDTATGRPVAVLLRPGKTPSGREVRGHIRRITRRIRRLCDTLYCERGQAENLIKLHKGQLASDRTSCR